MFLFLVDEISLMAGFKRRLLAQDDANERALDLAELAAGRRNVICRCNRCDHQSHMIVRELIAQFGPNFPVPEVGGRLRCAGCGAKDIATHASRPAPVVALSTVGDGDIESP